MMVQQIVDWECLERGPKMEIKHLFYSFLLNLFNFNFNFSNLNNLNIFIYFFIFYSQFSIPKSNQSTIFVPLFLLPFSPSDLLTRFNHQLPASNFPSHFPTRQHCRRPFFLKCQPTIHHSIFSHRLSGGQKIRKYNCLGNEGKMEKNFDNLPILYHNQINSSKFHHKFFP